VVSVREAIRAHVSADLVVLSGCEPGVTRGISREEVAGLTQGFLFAGARSLIVSLWRVDDPATAAMMSAFYAGRERGLDKGAALRAASEQVRATPGWTHPYYWGAFFLVGDWL
jgi:CHAT domain-containing protein